MNKIKNKIIDVLILIDTAAFQKGIKRVFMVSDHSIDKKEGSADLILEPKIGDYIRWRIDPIQVDEITNILEIIPNPKCKTKCIEKPFLTEEGWTSRVLSQGEESYTVVFTINGHGIFSWDPLINVRPR